MNLIDRYVTEVGKHLPRNQRADIEKEIRSTLLDMLEERDQASPDAEREAAVVALLKEYGEPRKVAETYVGPRYLIGPKLFPTFELIVKIVLAAVFGAGLLGFAISASITGSLAGSNFFSFLGEFWSDMLGGLFGAFGTVVVIFAVLERVLPAKEIEKETEEEWNPADLTKEPDPNEVKMSESIATIVFTIAGLIILNLFPNVVGVYFNTDGEWMFIPVLSDAIFTHYLLWINLLGGLQIAFHLYQLRQKVWTVFTRSCNIVIEVASIALAVYMLRGPSLIDLGPEKLAGTPIAEAGEVVAKIIGFAPSIALVVVIIVGTIEVAQSVYRLLNTRYQTA